MTYKKEYNKNVTKYRKENYHRIGLDLRFEMYERLQKAAGAAGESVSEYVRNAIMQRMESEGE